MPCDSRYLERDDREAESANVRNLLREVGITPTQAKRHHDDRYYGNVTTLDEDTRLLCEWCRQHDVKERSLELQIWWRDHQKADAVREEQERVRQVRAESRERAELARLKKKYEGGRR